MTPAEQGQERYICECPECGRVADHDDEGMWACAGGHSWTQPLAEPIKVVPADHNRVLEAELARVRGFRDACERQFQAKCNELLASVIAEQDARANVRVLVEALRQVVRLQKRWDAPISTEDHEASNRAWAAVGSEAHAIARAALETVSGDVQEGRLEE